MVATDPRRAGHAAAEDVAQTSTRYLTEHVDRLPFGSAEKADRYRTERYQGAVGRNWYACDPGLQFLIRYYMQPDEVAWTEPHLRRIGNVMSTVVAPLAEETEKTPPRLERYDKWGHDISRIVMPRSFEESKAAVLSCTFGSPPIRDDARARNIKLSIPSAAGSYMLDQADIGMACALGTGGDMVRSLVAQFAPQDVRDRVLEKFASGEWAGETAQLLTERTGGSDLAQLETTATRAGDAWLLNGFKWFASNANGQAWVVLAKPEGAPDTTRGVATFLVLNERRDGSRNGIRIRRLKDKLGTKSVASAEVEFVDAEAFLLSADPEREPAGASNGDARASASSDGKGLTRMMEMTNGARLGIAMMGLGCARRALVESICYASARSAFGARLIDQPLMRRKLAEMIVDVEAAQAMVFDAYGQASHVQKTPSRLRIGAPIVKLRAARLGITAASDAIEIHGGNGYVETWPVARILRDAQVNTIWEGPDNILCLDVRRGIERDGADGPFLQRLRDAVDVADPDAEATKAVAKRIDDLERAIEAWKTLDRTTAEARLFPLSQFMSDVLAGALLSEQAAWESSAEGGTRKQLVADLYAQRYLSDPDPLRGIGAATNSAADRFEHLLAGAFAP